MLLHEHLQDLINFCKSQFKR